MGDEFKDLAGNGDGHDIDKNLEENIMKETEHAVENAEIGENSVLGESEITDFVMVDSEPKEEETTGPKETGQFGPEAERKEDGVSEDVAVSLESKEGKQAESEAGSRENGFAYTTDPNHRYGSWIPEEPPKKKKKSWGKGIAVFAVAAVVFVLVVVASFKTVEVISDFVNGKDDGKVAESQKDEDEETSEVTEEENSAADEKNQTSKVIRTVTDVSGVVEDVMPSIVAITSTTTVSSNNPFMQGTYETSGAGSGIIIGENDTELLIVTNAHVVEDTSSLVVQFVDNETVSAKIKGTDTEADLAIIAVNLEDIKDETKAQIKEAKLGDSENLKVGEPAIAIGNALGYGQSVTTGVVSALNREITTSDGITRTLIQTDAAINPGNSGGALLNMDGEVIGINEVKYSSSSVEGMGYSIPISKAQPIIDELKAKETRDKVDESERGYLGIKGASVTEQASAVYGMPIGAFVAEIIPSGGAEAGGMLEGDVITKVDGQTVTSMEELQSILEYYKAGDTITVVVQRPEGNTYTEETLQIELGEASTLNE